MIAQIAVQGLQNRLFDYLIPDGMETPAPGVRVQVPFGKRKVTGIVISTSASSELGADKLKAIEQQLDQQPLLPQDIISLCEWGSRYYHHSLADILFNALPATLRKGEMAKPETETFWFIKDDSIEIRANAKKQLETLKVFRQLADSKTNEASQKANTESGIPNSLKNTTMIRQVDLRERGVETATLKTLAEKGVLDQQQLESRDHWVAPAQGKQHPLNTEQQTASDEIHQALGNFKALLLDGVTGSGKTEVYISAIQTVLQQGQSVLILVPEIGLTPQLVHRLEQQLQNPVACLHSGMNDKQRLQHWLKAQQGERKVLVGTRSALFTPMPDLGLIILDEEHDGSFKQQGQFSYHARDLAIVRAQQSNIPVVLGSATPSLETLANVSRGNFQHLKLTQRAGKAKPPELQLVDCRKQVMQEGFSQRVLLQIKQTLESNGQVMVYLNRRGFAPSISCADCGWMADCPSCDVKLTLHRGSKNKADRLNCHHCGYQTQAPAKCPECQGSHIQAIGMGTQRSEAFLEETFSDYKVHRLDRDKTRKQGYLQETLNTIRQGEPCLVIGTQMLAKGHDFPNLNLVVIQDADAGLFNADFRAAEKMAQTLLQVIGRAGRAEQAGKVMLQSRMPEHPYLMNLMLQDYGSFAQQLLEERERLCLPPYFYQVLVRASSIKPEPARDFLEKLRLQTALPNGVFFQGPWSEVIFRQANRYRFQSLLHSADRKALHQAVNQMLACAEKLEPSRAIRWSIDIDPNGPTGSEFANGPY